MYKYHMRFKSWLENTEMAKPFADSTVKGLVYHGTKKKPFKEFSYQKSKRYILFSEFDVESKGFFFSESPHDALEYGPNVVACYIRLRNPLLDPRRDKYLGVDRMPYKLEIDLQKILAPMIKKDDGGHHIELGVGKHYLQTRYSQHGREWIYHAVDGDGLNWDALDNPGVIQRMTKLGYDGTFVAEPHTSLGRSIFVPSSDQIQIVKWVNGPQEDWGDKDDYYVKRYGGFGKFYSPNQSEE
jgi:hypothetical protein